MLVNIVEGFLNDPVKNRLDGKRKAPSVRRLYRNVQPGTTGDTFRKKLNGGPQTQIIQDGRPELVRKVPQLLINIIEMIFDNLEPLLSAGIKVVFDLSPKKGERRPGVGLPHRGERAQSA